MLLYHPRKIWCQMVESFKFCSVFNPIQWEKTDYALALYVLILKNLNIYAELWLFILRLPVPVISAFQLTLQSWLMQKWSKRCLKMLVESAATTLLGKLFHTEINILQKSASSNYSAYVWWMHIIYVASCVENMTKVNSWIIIMLFRNYIIDLNLVVSQSSVFQCWQLEPS